jgi:DNA-binding NtrC family response regulator
MRTGNPTPNNNYNHYGPWEVTMNLIYEQLKIVEKPSLKNTTDYGKKFETEMPKKHVLIIDDDNNGKEFWRELLLSMLPGVTIHWASSISEAEQKIKTLKGDSYDLVISSFWLDGATNLYRRWGRKLRNFIFVSDLPINTREQKELLDEGYPVYLQKPFSLNRCRQLVSALCDLNVSINH